MEERPIAVIDIETTGDNPVIHEIIEIGLILINPKTLQLLEKWTTKVKPTHIETALAVALKCNGYHEREWEGAPFLGEAMKIFSAKTKGAIFCSYNLSFDWSFISQAFAKKQCRKSDGLPSTRSLLNGLANT